VGIDGDDLRRAVAGDRADQGDVDAGLGQRGADQGAQPIGPDPPGQAALAAEGGGGGDRDRDARARGHREAGQLGGVAGGRVRDAVGEGGDRDAQAPDPDHDRAGHGPAPVREITPNGTRTRGGAVWLDRSIPAL
jgi:hypothetical protein